MRTDRREEGFTLVELSIVCLCIGVLAGMAIPNYARSKAHVHRASCWCTQRHIYSATTLYVVEQRIPDGVINSAVLFEEGVIPSGLADCPESHDASHDDYDVTIEDGAVKSLRCRFAPDEHHWDP